MSQTLPLMTDIDMNRLPAATDAGFGTLRSERGPFPLQALSVRAGIDGLLAEVEVCQTYVNVLTEPLEATYIFPLPDRAAVSSFVMEVAGRRIEGILKERGEARQEYEQAIQAGHRAAISEEERPNVFTLRVGNLLPGERANIRFRMVQPLLFSDGEATFRFPLVVAPRYIPGEPLSGPAVGEGTATDTHAVPDASRITPPVLLPGFPNPVQLSLSADINPGGLPLSDLKSSLHGLCVRKEDNGSFHVDIQPGERLNRDFVLRFRLGDNAVRTGLLLQPDEGNSSEGTFTLTLMPPADSVQRQKPRDLVFLLDRSGSMSGWKMVAARRALARMIDTLTDADRFTVFAFDDHVELPTGFPAKGLLAATNANRFRCVEWLNGVSDRGGTELSPPLNSAVSLLAAESAERERGLVLLTDGQVGNEDDLLRMLGQRLAGLRIFTLGIDMAVNEGFLKRLALLGGGATEMVESEQRLDEVMGKIHRRLGTPVLTGLQIKGEGLKLDGDTLTPQRLPDLFAGSPLVVSGRYQGQASGSVALHAKDAAGRPWHAAAEGTVTKNPALTKLWARNRLRDLEDRYAAREGDVSQLEKQIVTTSLTYGVLCRFTAFIAVDRTETANADGSPRQLIQPVDAPAGWEMFDERMLTGGATLLCAAPAPQRKRAIPPPPACHGPCVGMESVDSYLMDYEAPAGEVDYDETNGFDDVETADYDDTASVGRVGWAEGLLDGIKELSKKLTTPGAPALDLTAYRQRAADLLQLLTDAAGTSASDRLTVLGIVAERLRELLEDLHSVGASPQDTQPLQELADALAPVMAAAAPTDADVQTCWTRVEQVLHAFVGGTAAAAPRKAFWK
jgi:Ca-activated chloride channel homolog